MLKGRRFWTFAMVLSLCVLVTAGCRRRSSRGSTTINEGSDIFTTDTFPGSDVQSNNVADDARAFSPSGQDFTGSLVCTFNGDRGTCMVTYATDGNQVYAQYYDGSVWTPPVALKAVDAVTSSMTGFAFSICHAFVNTSEHASEEAQERDGDCIIFWRATDTDDDGAGSDGANNLLFSTYFDVTNAASIAEQYGFQEFGTRLSSFDRAGENVETVALVTDGLCGEARWSTLGHNYSYGDQTTSIVVAWRQITLDGVSPADADVRAVRFDPAELLAADVPLTPSADTVIPVLGFGASNAGADRNETMVFSEYVTYNGALFYRCYTQDVFGGPPATPVMEAFFNFGEPMFASDADVSIQYVVFDLDTASFSATGTLNIGGVSSTAPDAEANIAEFLIPDNAAGATVFTSFLAQPEGFYGSDEGLATLTVVYVNLVEDPDQSTGFGQDVAVDTETDSMLCIAEIDEFTGTLLETGFVNFTDADLFAGTNDNVTEEVVDTQISRNGDYVWMAWLQRVDSGGFDEIGMRVAQYQTTRIDDDGLFPVPPLFVDSVSADFTVNPDSDGENVHWFVLQDGLGYICGVQSDPDVMNLFYEQSRDDAADLIDEIFFSRLDADTAGFPGTVPVVSAGVTWEVFELGDQPGAGFQNTERFNFNATDSGEGGNIFSVYRDDVDGTGTDDFRLFADASGLNAGIEEIDSEVTFRQVPAQGLTLIPTPPGSEIGRFDVVNVEDSESRFHPASAVHVLFAENESTEDSGLGFALRTRVWNTDVDAGVVFGDRFVPNATTGVTFEFPFDLDLPFVDPNTTDDASVRLIAVADDRVGVWFTEMQHVYYQEFSGNSGNNGIGWANNDGVSNPFLVDDDNDEELDSLIDTCVRSCVCNDLEGAMVFWTKAYGSGSGGGQSIRLQVRVRNGDSGN